MPTSSLAATEHTLASAYSAAIGPIEFVSFVISAGLIAWIVVALIKTNYIGVRVDRFRNIVLKTNLPREHARRAWVRIEEHFYKGGENDLKIAIIEADKLLDEALREAGIRGVNPGERLKNVKRGQLPDVEAVWQAHRVRNQIAHEANLRLKRDIAERTLKIYEEALRALRLID